MKRLSACATLLIVVSLVAWSCAGTPQFSEQEQRYIEGIVVEGGALGFVLMGDSGKTLRVAAYQDARYDPIEFHALAGDRLGVTYGVVGQTKTKNIALKVALLRPDKTRKEMSSPAIGIIREAGKTRHKIHLPEYKYTVIMLKGKTPGKIPDDWKPEAGDKVRVQFFETRGRFMRKTFYDELKLLEKGPIAIRDFETRGSIIVQGKDRFSVRMAGKQTVTFYLDPQTKIYPEEDGLTVGNQVQIIYYKKLMADRSLRPTAVITNKIE